MSRPVQFVKRHPWWMSVAAAVVLVGAGVALWIWNEVYRVPDIAVSQAPPTAPELTVEDETQILFRIDPATSSVSYDVDEHLAGIDRTAHGTTRGVAGDLVLDTLDPSASQLGTIVVNVAQLTSDESLRDRRLRADFLESGEFPLATFVPTSVEGLPAEIVDGTPYPLVIAGNLTVKESTAPVTLDAVATRTGDTVQVTATTDVLLSTFDVGPISIIGLVRTGDDATLTFDVTFVRTTQDAAPPSTTEAPAPETEGDASGPSFADTVMPVLQDNCASCHNDGGAGYHVWPLETAGDAAEVASGLAIVTESRYMPPWPATDLSASFLHDPSLSDAEIAAIVDWAAAGGHLDVDASEPIVATPTTEDVFEADVELRSDVAYRGTTKKPNDYRCFLVDPGFTTDTWVTGYEFEPDKTEVVHHALAYRVSNPDEIAQLRAADAETTKGGWDCDDAMAAVGQFLAWAPGQGATRFPDGAGLHFTAGDAIMMQIHYHVEPHGEEEPPADRSTLRLEVADPGAPMADITYRVYTAPAEIPCRPGLERGRLCNRDNVIAELFESYGGLGALLPDGTLLRCGKTLEDVAVLVDGIASSDCEMTIGEDATALAVFGHMHELGDTFTMTLNPGTDREQIVLDIAAWDFAWQMNYEFAEPLQLHAGDTLRIACTWDRNRYTTPVNRYVTWSEGTEDEMCYSALTLLPAPVPEVPGGP